MGLLDDSTPAGPQPGDKLGQYQLLTAVGAGGMGRVWAARQEGALQRLVAIKTALCDSSQTKEFERVFMDEARIASLINHQHVCGVYELGEADSVLYLVMEWSDGGTLLELIDESPGGKLSPPIAAYIAAKVCSGLHAAHELEDELGDALNVVHRDVTPQNILFSTNGQIRLADFGVAKAQGQLHRATETGEIKGKLSYIAPEQLTGKTVDRRVDVFALGCVLYEASLGTRPFHGDGALSTLYQILEQEVEPPQSMDPSYPAQLQRILMKALAKEPAERYQSAEDMRQELEAWLASSQSTITEATISELVNDRLRETIDQRQQQIDSAILRIDHPEQFAEQEEAQRSLSHPSSTPAAPLETVIPAQGKAGGGGWLLPGLLVGLTLGALGVFAWTDTFVQTPAPEVVAGRQSTSEPVQPASESENQSDDGTVRVVVLATPEGAAIQVDSQAPRLGLYTADFKRSEAERLITVTAPNYKSQTRRVAFDQDIELVIDLEPDEQPGAKPGAKAVTSAVRRPRKKPRAAVKPPTVSPKPRQKPDPTRRVLDLDNPFGN